MSYLIDSNIYIYAANSKGPAIKFLSDLQDSFHASVIRIEVLDYDKITEKDKKVLQFIFSQSTILPLSQNIIDKAIELR